MSHSYNGGKDWAIDDISFEIDSKGIVALLGSNGAGKSTTMNIICGVLNQSRGNVQIQGADIRNSPELAKKQLGFLPQNPPLYLDLTVKEYLYHAARLRQMPRELISAAIDSVMEKVSITHFQHRLIKNLSGGYRQRVGIAQAIIHQPQLVVFDEPTVGLDPNQIIEVRNLIKEIAEDRAVLFSTHILSEVELMCRDVLMIEGGKVIFNGSLEEFKKVDTPTVLLVKFERIPPQAELADISGVRKIEDYNETTLRIHFDDADTISKAIVDASYKFGWELKELSFERKSLDHIFSMLTKHSAYVN